MEAYNSILTLLTSTSAVLDLLSPEVSTELTCHQANMLILYGYRLIESSNIEEFLKVFLILGKLRIKGVPISTANKEYHKFIVNYMKVLDALIGSVESPETIVNAVSEFVRNQFLDSLVEFVEVVKNTREKSVRDAAILEGTVYFTHFPYETVEEILNSIDSSCLRERLQSTKYEHLHVIVNFIGSQLVKQYPDVLGKPIARIIVELFNNARAFTRKFLIKKTHSENLFLSSVELIMVCLSSAYVSQDLF